MPLAPEQALLVGYLLCAAASGCAQQQLALVGAERNPVPRLVLRAGVIVPSTAQSL